jgi:predicted acyl esterase
VTAMAFEFEHVTAAPVSPAATEHMVRRAVVRSTGPTMDVFARLLDVEPAGRDTPVRISLCHAGYLLRPGHGLRLHLAGSDFPEFVPSPGTGENPWLATETRTNEHSILLGGDEPARLTITVLP